MNGTPIPPPPAPDGAVPAVPSAHSGNGSAAGPSVAVATYDPQSGHYMTPDGRLEQAANVAAGQPKSWQDMLPS